MGVTSSGIEYSDDDKFTYFDFEIYEESVRPDYLEVLEASFLEFALSPWHDQDVNKDGTIKKKHRHIIYHHAGGPVKIATARKRLIPLGIAANDFIEPTINPRRYQRYLIHLDNEDKQQFEGGRNAIEIVNGFPLDLTRELTIEQKREVRKKCFEAIRENSIVEYCEIMDYCLYVLGDDEMFECVANHTIMFKGYLDSKRNSFKETE